MLPQYRYFKLVGSFGSQNLYALRVAIMSAEKTIPDNNEYMFLLPSIQIELWF
jgi:hypothetical protein